MQVVLKNKDKKNNSKRVGAVGIDVCAERISWYVKEKYIGGFESKNIRVWNSGRIFRRNKERVWRWRQRIKGDSRVERTWTRSTNYRWIYLNI